MRNDHLSYFLLTILAAVTMGFVVSLATFAIIGDAAFHLPGGSLSSGFVMGFIFAEQVKSKSPAIPVLFLATGAFSGVIGFLIFLSLFV